VLNLSLKTWPAACRSIDWANVPDGYNFAVITVDTSEHELRYLLELCRTYREADRARERWHALPRLPSHTITTTQRPVGCKADDGADIEWAPVK